MACTEATRSARSSAREPRADSRSSRAEASSGEEGEVESERMRRYEAKRGRVDESCARTSLLGGLDPFTHLRWCADGKRRGEAAAW